MSRRTLRKFRKAVRSLPDTADGIASVFRDRGIHGRPGSSCKCPVAMFLAQETGHEWAISIGQSSYDEFGNEFIEEYFADLFLKDGVYEIEVLPDNVKAFIYHFDAHCYEDLIED